MTNKESSELEEIYSAQKEALAILDLKQNVLEKQEFLKLLRELQKLHKRLRNALDGKIIEKE